MTALRDHDSCAPEPLPRRRWLIAALLGFGVLINYFDRVNLSVAKDALHNEFGLSTVAWGYVLSAYNWTYAALQLPTGVLLDRFGVQAVGRVSALLWSVATFGAALAPGIKSFFSSRLLLGVGEAPTFPAYAKATGNWFPRQERSLATAIFDSAAKFATGIGTPIIGLLLIRFGWRVAFEITGIASLVFFFVFYLVYRDPKDDKHLSDVQRACLKNAGAVPAPSSTKNAASLGYLLQQRKVLGLALGFAAYNYCFYLLLTWLPSYFTGSLHIQLSRSVLFSAVPWLFATATDLIAGGWLVDALVRRKYNDSLVRQTVLVSGMVLGLAILGANFTRNPVVAMWWITLSIGGLAASAPVAWSIPALIAPTDSVGKVGGIMNFANQLAALAAPIVSGYLIGASNNYAHAFLAAAVAIFIGIAGYVILLGPIVPIPEPD